MKWDHDNTIKLIEQFEMRPELWNCILKEYRNREKKANSLKEIATLFGIEEVEINRKWHNLRCQLNAEQRKIKKKKSGAGTSETAVKSNWEYFDSMF